MPRVFHSFRAEAIVIKHADVGEADRIITVFARQQGKLRVRAKGVRKIRSRRAGHLEPFTHVSLQLAKSRDLPIVTQAETVDGFAALRDDLKLLSYANYVAELLDKFTYEEGEHAALFNLFRDTLRRLAAPGNDPLLVMRYYEMRLLDNAGFRPELFHCVLCGGEIQAESQYFSAAQGGVVCRNCGHQVSGMLPISLDALRYLRHFQRSPYKEAARAAPTAAVHQEMRLVMEHYLTYTLERGLNTPQFIRRLGG
jgi:DNA repair protein RecO (recombination protein O)